MGTEKSLPGKKVSTKAGAEKVCVIVLTCSLSSSRLLTMLLLVMPAEEPCETGLTMSGNFVGD